MRNGSSSSSSSEMASARPPSPTAECTRCMRASLSASPSTMARPVLPREGTARGPCRSSGLGEPARPLGEPLLVVGVLSIRAAGRARAATVAGDWLGARGLFARPRASPGGDPTSMRGRELPGATAAGAAVGSVVDARARDERADCGEPEEEKRGGDGAGGDVESSTAVGRVGTGAARGTARGTLGDAAAAAATGWLATP